MAAVAAGSVLAGTSATATASSTSSLPPSLAIFAHCPVSNPSVDTCVVGKMTGSFTVGSQTLTTPSPATLTLGLGFSNGSFVPVAPTDGTPVLKSPPIPVTILGLPPLPGILSVTAVPQLVSLPNVNLSNLITATGTAVGLSLDVQVHNALLGSGCTIGSQTDPINVNLTAGTTNPPPPNQPITGSKGTFTSRRSGELIDTGANLVDNAFAVPGTNGCGLLGILDPVLNLVEGLPSAAGHNTASFAGNTYVIAASVIRQYVG